MKTLFCDYFVPLKESDHGDWWGAISITNHSTIEQTVFIELFEYGTGNIVKEAKLSLMPSASELISNTHPVLADISGRIRMYIDCDEKVMAKTGNSRGTDNAIVWENMQELPFSKA